MKKIQKYSKNANKDIKKSSTTFKKRNIVNHHGEIKLLDGKERDNQFHKNADSVELRNNKTTFGKENDVSNRDLSKESDRDVSYKLKQGKELSYLVKKAVKHTNIKKKRYKIKSFNKENPIKFRAVKGKTYQRKNYKESGYTRDRPKKDVSENMEKKNLDSKAESKKKQSQSSFQREEKRKEKLYRKKEKLEKSLKKAKGNKLSDSKGMLLATGAVNSYVESGKDDNAGVGAAHKVTDTVDSLARKKYYSRNKKVLKNQKKLSKLNKSIEKTDKKIFFKSNMEELKKTEEYQNTSKLKQFFKRREYKKRLAKAYKDKNNNSLSKKIKKFFAEKTKGFAEYIKARNKKLLFIVLAGFLAVFMAFQTATVFTAIITQMFNTTVSSTYLSDEGVLSNCNHSFSMMEQEIRDELDSVEENRPGYDEYIIKGKEKIGHDTHELLAYITAKKGAVKEVSEAKAELDMLINKMYQITYKEETEIRYKTVYYTYTDEKGNTQTGSYEEPYEYKKLIVTLSKKELDTLVHEEFKDYPNNLSHYKTLVASKGNMELVFGSGNSNLSEIVDNPDFKNPGIEFNEESVKKIVTEAEKHIGKRYVFGANGPSNFDCSSFVCFTYTHSGIKNMPRTTAWGIYKDYCNPVSPNEAKAGDIIFFKGTYNSGRPISHVGIYVGGGYMIHAGDPIQYAKIDTPYWREHFYSFGRVKSN